MNNYPLISIIIPTFNAEKLLPQALESIWNQNFQNYEVIVIDGGSTDSTVSHIYQNQGRISYFITEPDRGIYDAMNKGIDAAKGEWLYFLGADDCFNAGILFNIATELKKKYSIVFGDVLFDNGHRMKSYLGKRTWCQNTLHHQSAFYNRSLFMNFRYDVNLRVIADYELNLKVYASGLTTKYIPLIIANCSTGGASSNLKLSLLETNQVRARHIKSSFLQFILSFLLMIYYKQKYFRFCLYGHRI